MFPKALYNGQNLFKTPLAQRGILQSEQVRSMLKPWSSEATSFKHVFRRTLESLRGLIKYGIMSYMHSVSTSVMPCRHANSRSFLQQATHSCMHDHQSRRYSSQGCISNEWTACFPVVPELCQPEFAEADKKDDVPEEDNVFRFFSSRMCWMSIFFE